MGNIITGYLAREILKSSAATLLILYVILVSNAFGRVLADIADGDIPARALWPVLLAQSTNILTPLLPVAVFFGIVFAFGRMYKDHEIVVMNACGVGYREFYRPVAIVVLPVFVFSVYASLWLNPMVQRAAKHIVEQEQNQHAFLQIKPGQFNQTLGDDLVFFTESISEDRLELQEVIIGQGSTDERLLQTARRGRQKVEETSGDLFLVIGPGQRYEGTPGEPSHIVMNFEQHGILMENQRGSSEFRLSPSKATVADLWASQKIKDRAELQWRIASPVVLLVLALIAVPLAYIAPRQGRFGKVGYSLLVYIVYLNLMAITRARLEAGEIPVVINFWWVHAIFVILALVLLYRRNRGFFPAGART